jgi:hypothetical protein
MNAYSRPNSITLPELSADGVQRWFEKTQDLVLLLDEHDGVSGAFQGGAFAQADLHHWIGQRLQALVSADTRPKIDLLLANDAARDDTDDRWRHINLLGARGEMLPVLSRYMVLYGTPRSVRIVVCRDLRPGQTQNERYQSAHRELELTVLSLREDLRLKEQQLSAISGSAPDVQRLVERIKHGGFDQVIKETTQLLQRQCMQVLLAEAGGDPVQAARLAGESLEKWQNRAFAAGF